MDDAGKGGIPDWSALDRAGTLGNPRPPDPDYAGLRVVNKKRYLAAAENW